MCINFLLPYGTYLRNLRLPIVSVHKDEEASNNITISFHFFGGVPWDTGFNLRVIAGVHPEGEEGTKRIGKIQPSLSSPNTCSLLATRSHPISYGSFQHCSDEPTTSHFLPSANKVRPIGTDLCTTDVLQIKMVVMIEEDGGLNRLVCRTCGSQRSLYALVLRL